MVTALHQPKGIKLSSSRLLYLDWIRGIAAIIMLQGHVFNSFTKTELRTGGPYVFSQFVGGMPPAIFLFLTGVTLAFMMDSAERKGMAAGSRVLVALKRAGYLMAVAFLFRFQLWAFSSPRHVEDIFRVDILNCMGFALAACSVMAVFRTAERVRLCAVLGLAIAIASPIISEVNWNGVPELLKNYLVPSPDFFGFFPWAAFLFFGASYGSLQRSIAERQIPFAMQWFAMGGIGLAFGVYALSNLPLTIYNSSDFWLNGPALILIKTGVILLGLSFAYLWTVQPSAQSWSWVRQFGTTSLIVYWVHIELVYGRWMGMFKENLTIAGTVLAAIGVTLLMLGISLAKTSYPFWREKLLPGRVSPNELAD